MYLPDLFGFLRASQRKSSSIASARIFHCSQGKKRNLSSALDGAPELASGKKMAAVVSAANRIHSISRVKPVQEHIDFATLRLPKPVIWLLAVCQNSQWFLIDRFRA